MEFVSNFFFLFLGISQPVLAKNNAVMGFFNFLNFFAIFFQNLHARVEKERNSELKFYSLFLGLSHPVLAKNTSGKRFFKFLNFLAIFFGIFFARVEYERNSGLKFFFFSFSAYLVSFWLKVMPERGFLTFSSFLVFFSEYSCPGRA